MRSALVCGCLLLSITGCGAAEDSNGDAEPAESNSTRVHDIDPGTGGGAAASTTGSGASSACSYPAGPYGTDLGATVDGGVQFQVLVPGKSFATVLHMADLHDCDGQKGIHAVYLVESAVWCGPCYAMAEEIHQMFATTWQGRGITVVELIAENVDGGAPSLADAVRWREETGEDTQAYTGIDPTHVFKSNFYPYTTLVDPRTMRIVGQDDDYTFVDLSDVLALAQSNAAP